METMNHVEFKIVQPDDPLSLNLIADWYFSEWQIPAETTLERLMTIAADKEQFQVLMTLNGTPVATGGIYHHVGLLDRMPHLNIYRNWLALVYTLPFKRGRGYGAALCNYIQDHCRVLGIEKIHLFTHTAEAFYLRNGWTEMERMDVQGRNIVVMERTLLP